MRVLIAGGQNTVPVLSVVVKYLTGEMKPQMPLGTSRRWAAEHIDLVRNWIAAGRRQGRLRRPRREKRVSAGKPSVYAQPPVLTRRWRFPPDGKTLAVSGNREVLLHSLDGKRAAQAIVRIGGAHPLAWRFPKTDRC